MPLFLQLAMNAEALTAKEAMRLLDLDEDLALLPTEILKFLHALGVRPTAEDVWNWLCAAKVEEAGCISLRAFTELVRKRIPNFQLPPTAEQRWAPQHKLSNLRETLAGACGSEAMGALLHMCAELPGAITANLPYIKTIGT